MSLTSTISGMRVRLRLTLLYGLLFVISGLQALAGSPPDAPGLHVALGGAIASGRRLLDEAEELWTKAGDDVRERWLRDRPLLKVAEKLGYEFDLLQSVIDINTQQVKVRDVAASIVERASRRS